MSDHIMVIMAGAIVGLVIALLSLLFTSKENKHGHSSNKPSKGEELAIMKRELDELQAQIDEANNKKNARRKAKSTRSAITSCGYDFMSARSSSIVSGYDFKSALEELDTDVNDVDLFEEWDRRNSNSNKKYHEELTSIDQKLENDPNDSELEMILDQLKDLCFTYPEDVELLYRIGRVHVALCEGKGEDIVKIHIEQGITALSTALTLKKVHAEVHKWYAISIGLRAQFQPLTEKAKDGLLFKKHCELASALKPQDPVLHHLLGRFDFEIAGLSWFEKTMAGAFLGGSMNSTYADALKKFKTAENLSGLQRLTTREKRQNKTMIAKTLYAMDRKREAVQWLRSAKSLGYFNDPLDQEISTLLRKCS